MALITSAASVACLAPPALGDAASGESTITVNGAGAVMIAPDLATVTLQLRSTASTARGARAQANRRTRSVLGAVRKEGIDRADIQTSSITLDHFQTGPRSHRRRVYVASNALAVRITRVSLVGPVVDAATAAGADSIDGPQFSFASPSAGKARATRAALADARARADDAAAAVGEKVIGVRSIVIDPQFSPTPSSGAASAPARAKRAPGAGSTPVRPGLEEVDAAVTVVYLIGPAS